MMTAMHIRIKKIKKPVKIFKMLLLYHRHPVCFLSFVGSTVLYSQINVYICLAIQKWKNLEVELM